MFFKCEQDREDFEQEYRLRRFTSNNRASRRQVYCDYVRKLIGDTRCSTASFKRSFQDQVPFDDQRYYPTEKTITKDLRPEINRVLNGLGKFERIMLILWFCYGLPHDEIAFVLNYKTKSVTAIISKTLRSLRRKYKNI